MFCPSCGAESQIPDQKFCKICGTNLQVVSHVLKSTATVPHVVTAPSAPVHSTAMPGTAGSSQMTGNSQPGMAAPLMVSEMPSLPLLMEEEARHQRFHRMAWALILGGLPAGLFFVILSEVFRDYSWELKKLLENLALLGPFLSLTGVFFWAYLRIAFKKPNLPSVIVVQQQPGMPASVTSEITSPVSAANQLQLPPPPVSSFGQPPASVTEHTTAHLEAPFPIPSKNTH